MAVLLGWGGEGFQFRANWCLVAEMAAISILWLSLTFFCFMALAVKMSPKQQQQPDSYQPPQGT